MTLIRGTGLSQYPELVSELGGDPELLLRRAGVDPEDVGDRARFVPYRGLIHAVEAAAVATRTPDFGRRLGLRQGIEILGPVGVAARTARTVGGAFEILETYLAAYSPAIQVRFTDAPVPGRVRFEFSILLEDGPRATQTLELSVTVALRVFRLLIGPGWSPLLVHLPHEPQGPRDDYTATFGARVRFAERFAGFTMPREVLDRGLSHDEVTHQALVEYLETVVPELSAGPARAVRDLVRELLPTGTVSLPVIAAQFALSPKTLQRRLATEGTTFTDVLDDVRQEAAGRYLRDTELAISHISRELGYGQQSVLTRACYRWFGRGPAAQRRHLRTNAVPPNRA